MVGRPDRAGDRAVLTGARLPAEVNVMVVAGARAHFGLSRHAARLSGQKRPQPAPVFPHTARTICSGLTGVMLNSAP